MQVFGMGKLCSIGSEPKRQFSPLGGELTRKTFRIMKLTVFLLTCFFVQVQANGYSQTVTLSGKDLKLEQVFTAVKKQTGFTFFYYAEELEKAKPVNVDVKDATVDAVMEKCMLNQPFNYTIKGTTVFIVKKMAGQKVNSMSAVGIDVNGRVLDEKGDAVQASVTVKGTKVGTITDDEGSFRLYNINDDAILLISSVGFEEKQVVVNYKKNLLITLKSSIKPLDETIIKGYYSTSQRFNTGNVSKVKSDEIEKQAISNPLAALEGRVAGLQITQSSGRPGQAFYVRLRGQNSIASGNDPLYIVDGVPFVSSVTAFINVTPATPFNTINPSDIESIEVLKDADATAIYGSRGANGVILITTKRGKAGKTKVDANVYTGWGKITRKMSLLNTEQYIGMRKEAFKNDNSTPGATAYDINGKWNQDRYTDWTNILLGQIAHYNDAQASLSGGNNNTTFLIGAGYHKETVVNPGNYYDKKGSVHINLTNRSSNQKFRTNLSAFFSENVNQLPKSTGEITLSPNAPALYDSLGNLNWENSTWINPLSYLKTKNRTLTDNLNANLNLGYAIIDGLDLKSSFGFNYVKADNLITTPLGSLNPLNPSSKSSGQYGNLDNKTLIVEPQANYKRNISNGQLDFILGATFFSQSQNSLIQSGSNYVDDALIENRQAAGILTTTNASSSLYRYGALFTRLGYSWKSKYLFNATARRDGSSRFGEDKRFGNFGAIGIGWIFSEEKFVRNNIPWLTYGKFRASLGTSGNDQIGDYNYLNTYATTSPTFQGVTPLYAQRLANNTYAWEVNKKVEFGVELGLLNNKILFNGSYYRNRSSNQLLQYNLPLTTGFNTIIANFPAIVQNTGFEISLNTSNISSANFKWTSSFNLTIPRNKLVAYPDIENSTYANSLIVGQSLFINKVYQSMGVDRTTGLYTFLDFDNDNNISSPNDQKAVVYTGQQFFGGFKNFLQYKNFQLDFLFQFVEQKYAKNYLSIVALMPGALSNQPSYVLKRWQKAQDMTDVQKFSNSTTANLAFNRMKASTLSYSNASFIRLKTLSLSYQISDRVAQILHLQRLRFYIQAQNLWTFTNYLGYDPETISAQPPLKVITTGLQIGL